MVLQGDAGAQADGDGGDNSAGVGSAPASMAGTWPGAEGSVAGFTLSGRLHGPVVRNMTTGSLSPSVACGVLDNVAEEAEDEAAALTDDRMGLAAVRGSTTGSCARTSMGHGSAGGRTQGGGGSGSQVGDMAEAAGLSVKLSEHGNACGASRRVSVASGATLAVAGGARAAARVRGLRPSDGGGLYRRGVGRSVSELSLAGLCTTRRWSVASPDVALYDSVSQSLARGRASADSARTAGLWQDPDEGLHGRGSASAGAQSRWRASVGGAAGQAAASTAAVADVPAHGLQGTRGGGGPGEAEDGRRQQQGGKARGSGMSEADADSDEALLEVLSGAARRKLPLWNAAASGGSSSASYFDGDVGQGPADLVAEQASTASGARRVGDSRRLGGVELGSKSSSFRFAAPVVPPRVPPSVAAALPPAVGFAVEETDEPGSPFTAPASSYGEQHRRRLGLTPAGAGFVPASPRPPPADEDDFPVPPLAPPVVSERERTHATEHFSTHSHHLHHHRGATEPGSRGDVAASAGAAAAAGTSAAASAPGGGSAVAALSARNLLHHTQLLSEPVREVHTKQLVMQMPSPSPSQLGPIDPLSDTEGSSSGPAVLAAMAAAPAPNGGSAPGGLDGPSTVAPVGQGLTDSRLSSSSKIASTPLWGQHAAGAGVGPAALNDPLPRALVATRLSLSAGPQHGIAQHAAAIVAAAAAPANRAVSHLLSTNTRKSFGDESVPDADTLHAVSGDEAPPAAGLSGGRSFTLPQGMSQHSYMPRAALPVVDPQLVRRTSGSGNGSTTGMAGMLSTAALSSELGGSGVAMAAARSTRHAPITSSALHHVTGSKLLSLGAGLGGDSPEAEVEDAVIANRRLLDERGVLLEEVRGMGYRGLGALCGLGLEDGLRRGA